ncbi:MAG: response regulator [Desulfosarcina sp.]|nr:response regulator [Desulfobacterales bacterium]
MSDGLDVIIVDDDPAVCELITEIVKGFYAWGQVRPFTDSDEAILYCLSCKYGVAIFVVDVFLEGKSGFFFLDAVEKKFPSAHKDAIVVTGNASDDVVNMCMASDINHLLEKPIRPYALQFAVRAIAEKYVSFAKHLLEDQDFARSIAGLNFQAG